jgi:hypothetical protein
MPYSSFGLEDELEDELEDDIYTTLRRANVFNYRFNYNSAFAEFFHNNF